MFFSNMPLSHPELMVSVPPKFTAYQGFDVLFHATESYISAFASKMSDIYVLTSIGNVGKKAVDFEEFTSIFFMFTS